MEDMLLCFVKDGIDRYLTQFPLSAIKIGASKAAA